MALLGISIDKDNPTYTASDFTFWMPNFAAYIATQEGQTMFDNLYPIANAKVFHSIWGTDWKYAMSLVIAHYATIIANRTRTPSGSTLGEIAGGGVTKGVLSSAGIGGFNKSYDLDRSMINSDDAVFWNQTSYGTEYYNLYKTKAIPSIFVVTSNDVPGAN